MKYKRMGSNKGIAFVYLALILFMLLAIVGIVVDIGYMYIVKTQLQNAADAAALAGAGAGLGGSDISASALEQGAARQAAWKFACRNKAAGDPVYLVTNSSTNCDSPPPSSGLIDGNTGDIVVGYFATGTWPSGVTCESAGGGFFCPATGSTGLSINAIKTRPRRIAAGQSYGMGPVTVFIGQIFRLIGGDWSRMSAAASAIAIPGLPVLPLPLCVPRCDEETDFSNPSCPGKKLVANPPKAEPLCGASGIRLEPMAGTPSADYLKDYFNGVPYFVDVCKFVPPCVRTSQGAMQNSVLQAMEQAFNQNKRTETIGTDTVSGWRVLIPIICTPADPGCPGCGPIGPNPCPGDQPNPYYISAMAEVLITSVDPAPADSCPTCTGANDKGFTIIGTNPIGTKRTTIKCLGCGSPELDALRSKGRGRLVK